MKKILLIGLASGLLFAGTAPAAEKDVPSYRGVSAFAPKCECISRAIISTPGYEHTVYLRHGVNREYEIPGAKGFVVRTKGRRFVRVAADEAPLHLEIVRRH